MVIKNSDSIIEKYEELSLHEFKHLLYSTGIIINITEDGRIFFELKNIRNDSYLNLKKQCKGLILDMVNKNILSISDRYMSYVEDIKLVDLKSLYISDSFNIVKACDGTTITLYEFNNVLSMSTNRSVDISQQKWIGGKTFSHMFYEAASTNPFFIDSVDLAIKPNGQLTWSLGKDYCVTFGFTHPSLHLKKNDEIDIWLIDVYNRTLKTKICLDKLSMLKQNVKVKEKLSFERLIKSVELQTPLNDYINNFYGYILLMKDEYKTINNIPFHKVFIPNNLYKTIKKVFYSQKHLDEVNYKDRYLFNIIYFILENKDDDLSIISNIFPKYKEIINDINLFLDLLIMEIHKHVDSYEKSQYMIVTYVINSITVDEPSLDLKSIEACKVIHDYLKDFRNAKKIMVAYKSYKQQLKN